MPAQQPERAGPASPLLPEWAPFIRKPFRPPSRFWTVLSASTLLPARLISLILLLCWYYVFLRCLSLFDSIISRSFRRRCMDSVQPLARVLCFIFGFYSISVTGDPRSAEAPIVVANHTSYIDVLMMLVFNWSGTPAFIAREETLNTPFIGYMSKQWGCMYVANRGSGTPRGLTESIKARVKAHAALGLNSLVIFPEGTTTNGDQIIDMKLGAFVAGVPVKPLAIRYPRKPDGFAVAWDDIGVYKHAFLFLTQFAHRAQVMFLPIVAPDEGRDQDAIAYASKVQEKLAKALAVPVIRSGFRDKLAYLRHQRAATGYQKE